MKQATKILCLIALISAVTSLTLSDDKCYRNSLLAGEHCQMCKADYANWEVTGVYALRLPQQTLSSSSAAPDDSTGRLGCYKITDGVTPACLHTEIDKYGRCIRCACDFGFVDNATMPASFAGGSPQKKTCQENELRTLFCDQYDSLGNCIKCKWNQYPDDTNIANNDNRDPSSTIYKASDRLLLDYGLYKGKCYDNRGTWTNTNKVQNCAKYSSDTNPECIECHSRQFDMNSNTEWQAPGTQSALSWFRKVHLDYYLSDESNALNSKARLCKRYPANYVGLPIHLKRIDLTAAAGQNVMNGGDNSNGFTCKDPYNSKNLVKIKGCGALITASCTGEVGDGYFLCAEKVDKCIKYKVEDSKMDRYGEDSVTRPQFPYKVAKKCVDCEANFKPDISGICQSVQNNNKLSRCSILKNANSCNTCSNAAGVITSYFAAGTDQDIYCYTVTGGDVLDANCKYWRVSVTQNSDSYAKASFACWQCKTAYARSGKQLDNDSPLIEDRNCIWIGNLYRPHNKNSVAPGCGKLKYTKTPAVAGYVNGNDHTACEESNNCDDESGFSYYTDIKECGCKGGQPNSPQNRQQCIPSSAPTVAVSTNNCNKWYHYQFTTCLECAPGTANTAAYYRTNSWAECVTKLSQTVDGCIARTANNLCRLCDTTHMLDLDSHTCIVNVVTGSANSADNYNIEYCAFGKRTAIDNNKPVECYACHIGFSFSSTGSVDGVQKYCSPKTKKDRGLQTGSTTLYEEKWCYKYNQYDGKCSDCVTGQEDGLLSDRTRRCVPKIENCRVYELSLNKCFECERKGGSQLGVKADGTCESSRCTGRIGISYDGKWVCVNPWDDNCEYYGYNQKCAKCKDTHKLNSDGTCTTTCSGNKKEVKIFNGIVQDIKACVTTSNANFEGDSECVQFKFLTFTGNDNDSTCHQCEAKSILQPKSADSKILICGPGTNQKIDYLNDETDQIIKYECAMGDKDDLSSATPGKCQKTNDGPICNIKGDYTKGSGKWEWQDYGYVCDGAAGACKEKCISNVGKVPNCKSYIDGATANNDNLNSLSCCVCKPGYKGFTDVAGTAASVGNACDKKVCSKDPEGCAQVDNDGKCLKCVDGRRLHISGQTCVTVCPDALAGGADIKTKDGDIWIGYYGQTVKGCIPDAGTNTKFEKDGGDDASTCALWKYNAALAGSKYNNDAECVACGSGYVLQDKASDNTVKKCVKVSTNANLVALAVENDRCAQLDFFRIHKIYPDNKDHICRLKTSNADYSDKDLGYYCNGRNSEECVGECVDNNAKVKNCKSYTKVAGPKSWSKTVPADGAANCCSCKDGYTAKKADGSAASVVLYPSSTDDACDIKTCERIELCLKKTGDKCNLCVDGYKLDVKNNKCVAACPAAAAGEPSVAYKAYISSVPMKEQDICAQPVAQQAITIDVGGATVNQNDGDADGCTHWSIDGAFAGYTSATWKCRQCKAGSYIKGGKCVVIADGDVENTQNGKCNAVQDVGGKNVCDKDLMLCKLGDDFGFVFDSEAADEVSKPQCISNAGGDWEIPKCASYVHKSTAAAGSQLQIALVADKATRRCCNCKPGYTAKNDAGTVVTNPQPEAAACTIKTCTLESTCIRQSAAGICLECQAGQYLDLADRSCKLAADCAADKRAYVLIPGQIDPVDACITYPNEASTNFDFTGQKCYVYGLTGTDEKIAAQPADLPKLKCISCLKDYIIAPQAGKPNKCRLLSDKVYRDIVEAKKVNVVGKQKCLLRKVADDMKDYCKPNGGDYGIVFENVDNTPRPSCKENTVGNKLVPNCDNYGYKGNEDMYLWTAASDFTKSCCKCKPGYITTYATGKAAGDAGCNIASCEQGCEVQNQFKATEFCVKCKADWYLTVDRKCVKDCPDGFIKQEAWTGYYETVKACGRNLPRANGDVTNFIFPADDDANKRTYSLCDIWDFKDETATTFAKAKCVQCPPRHILQKQGAKYSCMSTDYSGQYLDDSVNDKCLIVDKHPSSGNIAFCAVDQCQKDYIFYKDAKDSNKGKCWLQSSQINGKTPVKYCKSMSGSAGVAITALNTAEGTQDIDKKCCECLSGFSPKYIDGQTSGCNIERCERHDVQINNDVAYENCQAYSFGDPSPADLSTRTCGYCLPGTYMKNGDTKKCYLHAQKHPACLSLNTNLGCAACAEPYILNNAAGADASANTCVEPTKFCIQYSNAGVCTRCEHIYYLSGAQCIAKVHGCKEMITSIVADNNEYDEMRPRCKMCLDSWNKLEGKCFFGCSQVKKVFDEAEKVYNPICCTCMSGYRMANSTTGECQKCTKTNCAQCSEQFDKCTMCNAGFYLNGDQCSQQGAINNCQTSSTTQQGICVACVTGNFYIESGTCKPHDVVGNCQTYSPTANECSVCQNTHYKSGPKACTLYQLTTIDNCVTRASTSDTCILCKDAEVSGATGKAYYKNSTSNCVEGKINNCVAYDQTDTTGVKCRMCRTGYGLNFDRTGCLNNALDSNEGGTPNCFIYQKPVGTSKPVCDSCNEGANLDADSFTLITNENEAARRCQKLSYCLTGFMERATDGKLYYKCTQCVQKTKDGLNWVARLLQAKKTRPDTNFESERVRDEQPQCVINPSTGTTVNNCKLYDNTVISTDRCVECHDFNIPEQINRDSNGDIVAGNPGGKWCKPQDLFCNIKGCKSYQLGTSYEWLKCFQCNSTLFNDTDTKFGLNSYTFVCDSLKSGGNDGATQFSDSSDPSGLGGIGQDGGLNFQNRGNTGSSGGSNNSVLMTFGFELILFIILGLSAFFI